MWPSLHQTRPLSPKPHVRTARRHTGKDAKRCPRYTGVFPVCSPGSPASRAGGGGGRSLAGPPLPLLCFPIPAIDLPHFSFSPTLPLPRVYFSSLLLHPIHLSPFPSHLPYPERLVRRRKSKPSFSQLYLPNKAWSQVLFKKRKTELDASRPEEAPVNKKDDGKEKDE